MMGKIPVAVIALLGTAGILAGVASAVAGAQAWVAVSSNVASPFASCTADYPEFQPGTNYSNSEIEPSLAVNPANERNIVAVWQQDRWSNNGSRGHVVATSFDGGSTWTTVTQTKTSLCTGGTEANGGGMFRAANPWLAFGPDGTAYLSSIGVPFFNQTAVYVNRSDDGGLTWSDPAVLQFAAGTAMNDKATITADPHDSRYVYAVWTRNVFPNEEAAPKAAEFTAASRGPAWFSRTTDGGGTWEPGRQIYDPGQQNGTLGHQIVVLPDDDRFQSEIVDLFELEYGHTNAHERRGVHVAVIRSADKGATWSTETLIADALPGPTVDPLTGAPVRTGTFIPDVAVDNGSGALYAVWLDARFSNGRYNEIALSMSIDGGLTWTAPVKANRTPPVAELKNRQAFTPSVHVAADGTVGISYYDFRYNGSANDASQPLGTDRFLARCADPSPSAPDLCPGGWTETRLTPASFDLRVAPNSVGLFLGGYQSRASAGNRFLSLMAQANSLEDPSTVYFTAVP
jgi:hypothetical protein